MGSDRSSDKPIVVIAVALIAVMLMGQVVLSTSSSSDYFFSVSVDGDDATYTISSKVPKEYALAVNDLGTYSVVDSVTIYYDVSRPCIAQSSTVAVGSMPLSQESYKDYLVTLLKSQGIEDIRFIDAAGLREHMIQPADPSDALVVLSGVLPDTVYTGAFSDPVFSWLADGGRLYWIGSEIGSCYSTSGGGVVPVSSNQKLFFGVDCINPHAESKVLDEVEGDVYRSALSLINNDVRYGLDTDAITDRPTLSMGYTDGVYDSVSLVQYGEGMVCVFGGDYSVDQIRDVSKVIASSISPVTVSVDVVYGDVNGTVAGTFTFTGGNMSAYVCLGGIWSVYGKAVGL